MQPQALIGSAAPARWFVVFDPVAANPWVQRLVPGRFKHVRACAYVPVLKLWLFYDVALANTLVMALPDGEEAETYIAKFTAGCEMISIAPRRYGRPRLLPFTCVSAVKQLIGLKSGALRPDALRRDCLAAGGTLLARQRPASPAVCSATA